MSDNESSAAEPGVATPDSESNDASENAAEAETVNHSQNRQVSEPVELGSDSVVDAHNGSQGVGQDAVFEAKNEPLASIVLGTRARKSSSSSVGTVRWDDPPLTSSLIDIGLKTLWFSSEVSINSEGEFSGEIDTSRFSEPALSVFGLFWVAAVSATGTVRLPGDSPSSIQPDESLVRKMLLNITIEFPSRDSEQTQTAQVGDPSAPQHNLSFLVPDDSLRSTYTPDTLIAATKLPDPSLNQRPGSLVELYELFETQAPGLIQDCLQIKLRLPLPAEGPRSTLSVSNEQALLRLECVSDIADLNKGGNDGGSGALTDLLRDMLPFFSMENIVYVGKRSVVFDSSRTPSVHNEVFITAKFGLNVRNEAIQLKTGNTAALYFLEDGLRLVLHWESSRNSFRELLESINEHLQTYSKNTATTIPDFSSILRQYFSMRDNTSNRNNDHIPLNLRQATLLVVNKMIVSVSLMIEVVVPNSKPFHIIVSWSNADQTSAELSSSTKLASNQVAELQSGFLGQKPVAEFLLTTTPGIKGAFELNGTIQILSTPDTRLQLSLVHSSEEEWRFSASVKQPINLGEILSHFLSGHDLSVFQEFMNNVNCLNISLGFESSRSQTVLTFKATIGIGSLQLDLVYRRNSASKVADTSQKAVWSLEASLREPEPGGIDPTIKDLISGIAAHDLVASLPEFVTNTRIPRKDLQASLRCFRAQAYPEFTIFRFSIQIGTFRVDFIQLKQDKSFPKSPVLAKHEKPQVAASDTIRILRVSIDKFPETPAVPLIGKLPQPFEQLDFFYTTHDIERQHKQLLDTEVFDRGSTANDAISAQPQLSNGPHLMFKEPPVAKPKKSASSGSGKPGSTTTEVLAAKGSHFIVVVRTKEGPSVLIDYAFNKAKKNKNSPKPMAVLAKRSAISASKPTGRSSKDASSSLANEKPATTHVSQAQPVALLESQSTEPNSQTRVPSVKSRTLSSPGTIEYPNEPGTDAESEDADPPPSSTAPMQMRFGPLSISSLGLKLEGQTLTLLMDAMVTLGPVELALYNFQLTVHLENVSLHDLRNVNINAALSGLGLGITRGKFTIAGLFKRISDPTQTGYAGGITVSASPYTFLAAGAYLEQAQGFKTIFGFMMVTGPLMELGWAEVRGITGGFGYNSTLREPDISEVSTFPFLSHTLANTTKPLEQLDALTKVSGEGAWIKPLNKSFWIAAGLMIKAVQVLDVQAVITIDLGESLRIGVIGEAVASMPQSQDVSADQLFVLLDIAIKASVDFGTGTMQVEAQLTPASFVLSRQCHPTGGFALCTWFGSSPRAGDWVFTVGGYHPAYDRPSHYPNPPRLGISWKYDDHISITGQAYFAITPHVCMGGGSLSAIFELGPISAHFDAHADMLMMYDPFQYRIDVGVSMGVAFRLKLLFVTLRLSFDIGASVSIEGPPMSGTVHVDLSVVSFDVAFGASRRAKPALTLEQFWQLVKKSSSTTSQNATAAGPSNQLDDHIFTVTAGLMPTEKLDPGDLGVVRAGMLELQIHSRAPISRATCKGFEDGGKKLLGLTDIYAKPTRKSEVIVSDMKVGIACSIEGTDRSRISSNIHFGIEPVFKRVPAALWSKYNPATDPADSGDNKAALDSSSPTVNHLMGISLKPPPPILPPSNFPPFDVESLIKATVQEAILLSSSKKAVQRGLKYKDGKAKLKGLWGSGISSAELDSGKLLNAFATRVKKSNADVAARFQSLKSTPSKKIYKHFDLYYSGDVPSIANIPQEEPVQFQGLLAGRWSTQDERNRSIDEEQISSKIELSPLWTEKVTGPARIFAGISMIDAEWFSEYSFTVRAERAKKHEWKVLVQNTKGSVVNGCEVSWLASFDPKVAIGTCSYVSSRDSGVINVYFGGSPRFTTPPNVVVWLTGFSTDRDCSPMVQVSASNITTTGCSIVFDITGSTRNARRVECAWLAFPFDHKNIRCGRFDSDLVPSSEPGSKARSGIVSFSSPLETPPRVLVAFDRIKWAKHRNLCVGVDVDNVSTIGGEWHVSTWGHSLLFSVGGSFIALA